MASEVKTNKLSPSTGVTVTLGDASDVFQLPASAEIDIASGATLDVNGTIDVTGATVTGLTTGIVLQVVQTAITLGTASTTSTSFVDITGMTVDITPVSTSNKVLVFYSMQIGTNSGRVSHATLLRDTTEIFIGDASGSQTRVTTGNTSQESDNLCMHTMTYLDSPSTTSATTYKLQWRSETGQTIYLNRDFNNADTVITPRGVSSITVMEIAA